MNLRDLKIFVATRMDDRLAECGIDLDQITQIKIYDRKIPSKNLVWELKVGNHCYSYIVQKIYQWINNQIIVCYMNNDPDRDLAIEVTGNGKGMMAI